MEQDQFQMKILIERRDGEAILYLLLQMKIQSMEYPPKLLQIKSFWGLNLIKVLATMKV